MTFITYREFMAIARAHHAWGVIETWDAGFYALYCAEFGPMTVSKANELCRFLKAEEDERAAAGEFFSRR